MVQDRKVDKHTHPSRGGLLNRVMNLICLILILTPTQTRTQNQTQPQTQTEIQRLTNESRNPVCSHAEGAFFIFLDMDMRRSRPYYEHKSSFWPPAEIIMVIAVRDRNYNHKYYGARQKL